MCVTGCMLDWEADVQAHAEVGNIYTIVHATCVCMCMYDM